MQDKVDDQEGRKYQAPVIMHGYPLVTGDTKIRGPSASPPTSGRQDEIENQAGDE
jgi:hypothetical protein